MRFKPYPKYKPSGVEWLGDVPEGWSTNKLGLVCRLQGGFAFPSELFGDEGIPVVRMTNLKRGRLDLSDSKFIPASEVKSEFALQVGDLIWGMSGSIGETGSLGNYAVVALENLPAQLNQRVGRFRVDEERLDSMFNYYIVQSPLFSEQILLSATGTAQFNISSAQVEQVIVAIPPVTEQMRIVMWLDDSIKKIDTLISKQEKLIELLKEKRQAVISHAVTKGLDPTVPMKDSGVEWLGDVPAHWSVGALRYFSAIGTGATPDRSNELFWNGEIPWVKTGEINYSTIMTTEETISNAALESCSVSLSPPGTLLLALYGQGVTRGRVAILGIHATYNQACAAIQTDSRLNVDFLHAFFVFAYRFIREMGNETTQMNLNVEFVKRIFIVAPPLAEQRAIANYISNASGKIDALIAKAEQAIVLQKEHRTALISAAVTGKIVSVNVVPSCAS